MTAGDTRVVEFSLTAGNEGDAPAGRLLLETIGNWVASAEKHYQYQSGIVLEGEIYEAVPFSRGHSYGVYVNHTRRQGTGEYLNDAEPPDNVVCTLLGRYAFEIRDYIEKYKEFGISKNLDARFTLKNQKEQVNA